LVVKAGSGIGKGVSDKEKTAENSKKDEEMNRIISERLAKTIRQSRIIQKKSQKTN
jgi:hypothetical protein